MLVGYLLVNFTYKKVAVTYYILPEHGDIIVEYKNLQDLSKLVHTPGNTHYIQ